MSAEFLPRIGKQRHPHHRLRDPEMRQTKKGNHWYFGAKAHIRVVTLRSIA
jgi:IS5 family transposase